MIFLIQWLEAEFPAAKPYIDFAVANIDPAKLHDLLLRALKDYQAGMTFKQILIDLLTPLLSADKLAELKAIP